MTRIAIAAAFALAGTLGACDSGPPPARANLTEAAAESGNQIAALPEGARDAVFIRAIRDSGQECQHVDWSEPAGEHQGFPVWTAHCDRGETYTIVLTGNGNAQVINAAERQLADGPARANAQ